MYIFTFYFTIVTNIAILIVHLNTLLLSLYGLLLIINTYILKLIKITKICIYIIEHAWELYIYVSMYLYSLSHHNVFMHIH